MKNNFVDIVASNLPLYMKLYKSVVANLLDKSEYCILDLGNNHEYGDIDTVAYTIEYRAEANEYVMHIKWLEDYESNRTVIPDNHLIIDGWNIDDMIDRAIVYLYKRGHKII